MIAIIKGCGNNINSIQFAFDRLGAETVLTDDPSIIIAADRVILPGVGHANFVMQVLRSKNLVDVIKALTKPVLGICLGMQLLFDASEEGETECLGIIPGRVTRLPAGKKDIIPHMGWNTIKFLDTNHVLASSLGEQQHTYFVHSYAAPINEYTVAETEYTDRFASVVQRDNFYGMQFHPERSSVLGELLLKNFIGL